MATTPVPVKQSGSASGGMPDAWRSLRTEMDRLFDRFTSGFGMSPFPSLRFETSFGIPSPAMDITEDEAAFKLSVELPGLTEKDIQVSLSGDMLTIKGEKRQEREEKAKNYYLSERSYGEFQRAFILPEGVERENIAAVFANGVLTVTLPKTHQAAPKKIEVKGGA
jgi:HSP20 family protein